MIASLAARIPRPIAFVGFNAGVIVLIIFFVLAPLIARFSDRADAIAEDGIDLAHQQAMRAQALSMVSGASPAGEYFLPGHDYPTADADLQQILKTLASRSGVRFISMRGLSGGQTAAADHTVTAKLDVEGSLRSISVLIQSIETNDPCLFIGALTMRANGSQSDASSDGLSAHLSILGVFKRPTLASGE